MGLERLPQASSSSQSDSAIVSSLLTYRPVTDERNIWAFWDTGLERTKPWVRRNITNWVRRLGPSWTVRVIDLVPESPLNIYKYVSKSHFPDVFNEKGTTVPVRSADFIRLVLLFLHGGVWMDVGTILLTQLDEMFWNQLQDLATPYEMAVFVTDVRPGDPSAMTPIIAARKGTAFVERWMKLFKLIWQDSISCHGFRSHPLLKHLPPVGLGNDELPQLSMAEREAVLNQWTDYVALTFCFERLSLLEDPTDGFSGRRYLQEQTLVFDAMKSIYYADFIVRYDYKKMFDYLLTPYSLEDTLALSSGDEDAQRVKEQQHHEAKSFVENILRNAYFFKVSHGMPVDIGYTVFLGRLWDQSENANADAIPGTFGSFLRWASVHVRQTRELKPSGMGATSQKVRSIGLFEAVEN